MLFGIKPADIDDMTFAEVTEYVRRLDKHIADQGVSARG